MSKKTITLADILAAQKPLTRTKTIDIEGVGEFVVHELTAAGQQKVVEAGKQADSGVEAARRANAALTIRLLEGEDHEPTDAEIDAVLSRLSDETMRQIFVAGFWFDGEPDELKKSS